MDVNGVFRQDNGNVASAATTISGSGVLEVNQLLLSGANSTLNFDGGTLKAGAGSAAWLAGNGAVRINSGGATIDTGAFAVTASSALTENGASTGGGLTKTGSGTLTLTSTNTYTGATIISGGTLQLSGSGSLNSGNYAGAIALSNSATFENVGNATQFLSGAISGNGTVAMNNGDGQLMLQNAANSFTALNIGAGRVFIDSNTGALPAAATVGLTGGTLDFNVGGTYASAITVSSGANIAARAATTLSNVTLPGTGTVIFNNDDAPTAALGISSGQTLTGSLTVQVGGDRMGPTGGALGGVTFSGKLTGSGSLVMTSSGNISNPNFGTGVLTLTNASNDYTGTTTINGGTLSISASGHLGDGLATIAINGGTLRNTGATVDLGANRAVAIGASGGTVEVTTGNALTLSGAFTGTGSALTKTGNGTLNFAVGSTQSYGTLAATAGTTNLNSALGTGASTINANATVNINASQTLAALNIADGAVVTLGGPAAAPAPFSGEIMAGAATQAVPEPGSATLLLGGLATLLGLRRRRG